MRRHPEERHRPFNMDSLLTKEWRSETEGTMKGLLCLREEILRVPHQHDRGVRHEDALGLGRAGL